MGSGSSKQKQQKALAPAPAKKPGFVPIADQFKTLEEVQTAMKKAGLESSNLIFGIDYTKSNLWTGKRTFGGRCLHTIDLSGNLLNPYQQVVQMCARTLEPFDDDHLFPVYGFGDVTTRDQGVFPFYPEERPCNGIEDVLRRYTEITPSVQMLGPTSFAPIIHKAIELVKATKQYHILIIICDGQVTAQKPTRDAIVEATQYPLSIVTIGVGDGPWDEMEEFDDGLPARRFDNFQFVPFNDIMNKPHVENYDVEFAVAALMEIPDQYKAIRALGLLE